MGSESHYTVLFALDPSVQNENELEGRETQIRKAFDAQDQSGGGGFISVEGFHQVLRETNIKFPPEKLEHLCSSGFIVWSEFWQVILDLDKSLGGLKDSSGLMGKKVFDHSIFFLYIFLLFSLSCVLHWCHFVYWRLMIKLLTGFLQRKNSIWCVFMLWLYIKHF